MEFTEREKLVLAGIIDYYLNFGETIGSRSLVKRYDIKLSSATIRNVMADLEEMGYIAKTHTSSGRVPTDKGYKYYLEEILKVQRLSEKEMEKINLTYEKKVNEIEEILEKTSKLLSKLSSYAGLVIEPTVKSEKIKKIQLVHVNDYALMAVIIMENSTVKTKKIHLKNPMTEEEVLKLSLLLNTKIKEHNRNILPSELEKIIVRSNENIEQIANKCFEDLEGVLYLEGTSDVVRSIKTENSDEVIDMIDFFEGKQHIKSIFERIALNGNYEEGKVNVILGEDLESKELENISFIFSIYNFGEAKGVIGVIGPKRMEYSKTMGLVKYVSKEVNKVMKDIDKENAVI